MGKVSAPCVCCEFKIDIIDPNDNVIYSIQGDYCQSGIKIIYINWNSV